jgi:uncharacterized protein YacL
MKGLKRINILWIGMSVLAAWNLGLTLRTSPSKIVTIDVAAVARVAAQVLSESEVGEVQDDAKELIAKKLRSAVQTYAEKHNAVVVDSSSIIAGQILDITKIILKEIHQ